VADCVAEFGYNAASIGFDYHGAVKQQQCIDGVWTTCIVEAKLFEVSFCAGYQGAVPSAFVGYGEVDYGVSLRDECLSGKYLHEVLPFVSTAPCASCFSCQLPARTSTTMRMKEGHHARKGGGGRILATRGALPGPCLLIHARVPG